MDTVSSRIFNLVKVIGPHHSTNVSKYLKGGSKEDGSRLFSVVLSRN